MSIGGAVRPASSSFTLANGLRVVLAPIPSSPTVSVWVWYRVGSKNEHPGITGASHWVEHMLFKGSPRYPRGAIDRAVVEVGGSLNAFTSTDFTAYLTTVPKEHQDVPLSIEADRMTRALFEPREVERERTVIHSEREGNENWPEFRVSEELYALAFTFHPYRWDALGLKEDIVSLSARDLAEYYHRFYGTRNALLVITGEFDLGAMRERVTRLFARLRSGGDDPTVRVHELPPRGERRATLSGPGTTPYLEIGWRAPSVDDPRNPAVILIDAVLGGETRLFATGAGWGRAREHPSSRLYRKLVDPGLAVRATSEWRPRVHPSLFTIQAQAAHGVSLDRIEAAILAETARVAREGPTAAEVREARVKVRRGAELAYEGATRTAFRLGYFASLGPPGFEQRLLRRVLSVTPSEVRTEAARLFRTEGRVVVGYEPTGGAGDG